MTPTHDPVAALVYSASARDVLLTVVGGDETYCDGRVAGIDWRGLRARAQELAGRLREP
jgi:cytosine/adenosine deaminase-related metal-dependent hydrolase